MLNYRITLGYLGRRFKGAQIQPNGRTIEGELRSTLSRIGVSYRNLILAARTDSGVNASGQVISFQAAPRFSDEVFFSILGRALPDDLRLLNLEQVQDTFHPRGSARLREYRYWISVTSVPLPLSSSVAFISHNLNLNVLNRLAGSIIGKHDFSAFQNRGSSYKSAVKFVVRSEFYEVEEYSHRFSSRVKLVCYVIVADSFLYRMVRNLVGAMLATALGRMTEQDFFEMLESGQRIYPYVSAPSEGLELFKIYY